MAVHFQGALDALRVVRLDASGSSRIHLPELRMKWGPAEPGRTRFQLGAKLGLRCRQVCQALRQRAKVQHGAAGQERDSPARMDLADQSQRVVAEAPGGIRL